MRLSNQKKVAVFAAPLALVGVVAGTTAFTAGNDATAQQAEIEALDYLTVQRASAAAPIGTILTDSGATLTAKEGHLPEFTNTSDGINFVPGGIIESGEILYIDSASGDSDAAGNVLEGLRIEGDIVNASELATNYDQMVVPVRVYNTADLGATWVDVTADVLDVAPGDPFWLDARDGGNFEMTLRGPAELDEHYTVVIERGGSIVPAGEGSAPVAPQWVFDSTPLVQ